MKKIFVFLVVSLFADCIRSQSLHLRSTIEDFNSGALNKKFFNAFSVLSNPAALTNAERFSIGIFSERRFMVKELNYNLACISFPANNKIAMGFEWQRLGWKDANISFIAFSIGKVLGKVQSGLRMGMQQQNFVGYKKSYHFLGEMGIVLPIQNRLSMGLRITIPSSNYSTHIYGVSLGYEIEENLYIAGDWCLEQNTSPFLTLAIIYKPSVSAVLQAGYRSDIEQPFFSMSWSLGNLGITTSIKYDLLGTTPGLGLQFFSKSKSFS